MELAFVTALQQLPARQRAVLIMRDVTYLRQPETGLYLPPALDVLTLRGGAASGDGVPVAGPVRPVRPARPSDVAGLAPVNQAGRAAAG